MPAHLDRCPLWLRRAVRFVSVLFGARSIAAPWLRGRATEGHAHDASLPLVELEDVHRAPPYRWLKATFSRASLGMKRGVRAA